jgi:CBS domain containing-hemolysin-like protein
MTVPMTPAQQAEAVKLQRQLHAYLDNLSVAGFNAAVIAASTLTAVCERLLLASTPTQAAAVLRGHALLIEKYGETMVAELCPKA